MQIEDQVRQVKEQWHKMITSQDLDGLMALYTDDATLESSAILVLEGDPTGTLKGKDKLRKHFRDFLALMAKKDSVGFYQPKTFYTDGENITWEYPSKSPNGLQLDLVESVDLVGGKIAYQRVYWGWVGFKILSDAAETRKMT
jgi:steroid Delta-isomerase